MKQRKVATWNVQGMSQKETELTKTLIRMKIDFAITMETRKK